MTECRYDHRAALLFQPLVRIGTVMLLEVGARARDVVQVVSQFENLCIEGAPV